MSDLENKIEDELNDPSISYDKKQTLKMKLEAIKGLKLLGILIIPFIMSSFITNGFKRPKSYNDAIFYVLENIRNEYKALDWINDRAFNKSRANDKNPIFYYVLLMFPDKTITCLEDYLLKKDPNNKDNVENLILSLINDVINAPIDKSLSLMNSYNHDKLEKETDLNTEEQNLQDQDDENQNQNTDIWQLPIPTNFETPLHLASKLVCYHSNKYRDICNLLLSQQSKPTMVKIYHEQQIQNDENGNTGNQKFNGDNNNENIIKPNLDNAHSYFECTNDYVPMLTKYDNKPLPYACANGEFPIVDSLFNNGCLERPNEPINFMNGDINNQPSTPTIVENDQDQQNQDDENGNTEILQFDDPFYLEQEQSDDEYGNTEIQQFDDVNNNANTIEQEKQDDEDEINWTDFFSSF